jgi:hypothetical protein
MKEKIINLYDLLQTAEDPAVIQFAIGELEKVEQEIEELKREKFNEGVRYALEYLSDVFEGVQQTDLWADFKTEKVGA